MSTTPSTITVRIHRHPTIAPLSEAICGADRESVALTVRTLLTDNGVPPNTVHYAADRIAFDVLIPSNLPSDHSRISCGGLRVVAFGNYNSAVAA